MGEEQGKNKTTKSIQSPFFMPPHHHLPKFPTNLQHFTIVIHIVDFVGLPNSANGIRTWIDDFLTGKNIHVRAFKQHQQTNNENINQQTSIDKHQLTQQKPREGNGTTESGRTVLNGHHKSHVAFWVSDVKGKVGILLDFGFKSDIGESTTALVL